MKKFLALTSIEEAIDPAAEEIVYIENGCLKKQEDMADFDYVDRPFKTNDELAIHIKKAGEEYKIILKQLSLALNNIHGESLSTEAWDEILHMWLPYYIEAMYSKYLHLKKAIADNVELYTNILAESSFIHPYFAQGFWMWSLKREDYNFQLYSHVAQFLGIEIKKRVEIRNDYPSQTIRKESKHRYKKEKFLNVLGKRAETIIICPDHYNFNLFELLTIIIKSRFRIGVFYPNVIEVELKEFDGKYREGLKIPKEDNDSEFVKMIKDYIFTDIPTMYLEGFQESMEVLRSYRCSKIISTEDYCIHLAAILMGKTKNAMGKIYFIPVGGDGNIWQGRSEARADSEVADVLYTTGWRDKDFECELRRITNPRYWRAKKSIRNVEKRYDILYLASITCAYCTVLSNMNSIFTKEYIEDSLSFVDHLAKDELRVKIRLFLETGWNLPNRIKGEVEIDNWSSIRFIDMVQECRLCIVDSFGTAWAEVLAMRIPLIMVIPEYMEFFTDKGWELINKLKSIGMYYNNYQEAEMYIKNNIENIELWWNDKLRQGVVEQICEEYVWCADNAKKEWIKEFINIAKE